MKKMSVREFKKLCDKSSLHEFIFSSDNQKHIQSEHNIKVSLTFPIMLISLNPNVICFKNSENYLFLDKVKYVNMNPKESVLGTIFNIVCENPVDNNKNDISYTFIAR